MTEHHPAIPGAPADEGTQHAIAIPDRRRRSSFVQRLARRAGGAPLALCAGIDPAPAALELLGPLALGTPGQRARVATAGAIERFAGLVIESVRDHAVAVKPQVAWFEAAGAPGIRALERTIAFARTAGLLVVLDAKRGDIPHSAAAYADAWLGDGATSGAGVDAITINPATGRDAVEAMAEVAAQRHCALYALLYTSNPGAATLQAAELAVGGPWWHLLARELRDVDEQLGGGIVGAVVGATRPGIVAEARELLPAAPLLLPGVGAQGGSQHDLAPLAEHPHAPTALVPTSRALLPSEPGGTHAFRFGVDAAAARLAASLARVGADQTR